MASWLLPLPSKQICSEVRAGPQLARPQAQEKREQELKTTEFSCHDPRMAIASLRVIGGGVSSRRRSVRSFSDTAGAAGSAEWAHAMKDCGTSRATPERCSSNSFIM